jgi:hypothetical protein
MGDTKKNIQKKSQTRKFKNIKKKNIYHNFQRDVPILESIFQKYPHLLSSYSSYKQNGYQDINYFLRNEEISLQEKEKLPKQIPTDKEQIKTLYSSYYGNPNKIYAKLLYTLTQIKNLFTIFDKYKPYGIHPVPLLYRGITQSPDQYMPDSTLFKKEKPLSIPYFQSCSKSYQIALSFQGCSVMGPCCLYILHVRPDVQCVPFYWQQNASLSESFTSSEYEILVEPFVEYKLRKTYKQEFSASDITNCPYDRIPPTFLIDVYELDVLPPPKGARDFINTFYKKVLKGIPTLQKYIHVGKTDFIIDLFSKKK